MWRCRVGMAQSHRSHALRVPNNGRNNARIHDRHGRAVHTGTAARTGLTTVGRRRLATLRGWLVRIHRMVMLVAGHLCLAGRNGRDDHGRRCHVACMNSRHCGPRPVEHEGYGE